MAGLSVLDVLAIATRPGATVFQQVVSYLSLGFTTLVAVVCFGCVHIGWRIDALLVRRPEDQ
jgi:hypothetical protein